MPARPAHLRNKPERLLAIGHHVKFVFDLVFRQCFPHQQNVARIVFRQQDVQPVHGASLHGSEK